MLYTIKKGKHFAKPKRIKLHFGITSLKKKIVFKTNCFYKFNNVEDADINKVFGFTTDIFGRNSVRIGWKIYDALNGIKSIRLYGYTHINGKKSENPDFDSYQIGKFYSVNIPIECTIHIDGENAYFSATQEGYKGENHIVKIPFPKKSWFGYYQRPYFGGNMVAPHNMSIELFD